VAELDDRPGFRRRFRVTPSAGEATAELEDDFHCMRVTLRHDGAVITAVEGEVLRAPWNTCPDAAAQLRRTFTGVRLDAAAVRGEKSFNCTHLHDLAILAATHAGDAAPFVVDILVSDPADGIHEAELRRDGTPILHWTLRGLEIVAPPELAGVALRNLRTQIDAMAPADRENARLLRWAAMVSHGRIIPLAEQSDARHMPSGSCYTFQPDVARVAHRIGVSRDFSKGEGTPLDGVRPARAG